MFAETPTDFPFFMDEQCFDPNLLFMMDPVTPVSAKKQFSGLSVETQPNILGTPAVLMTSSVAPTINELDHTFQFLLDETYEGKHDLFFEPPT